MGRIGPTEIIIVFMLLAVIGVVVAVVVVAVRSGSRQSSAPTHAVGRWAADPSRRHELRWWDGTRWTPSVSDSGVLSHDPLS
jgi:Protein of unknown function (DUF2510)